MYISVALLDNCKSYPFRRSQSARKITSGRRSTQYTRWMYKGSIAVLRGVGKSAHGGTRHRGMFRRVGRTHTGGGKTWWPTGCGIHQRRCSAYLLRSRLFYRSPCTRVYRHEGEREKRARAREKEREIEKGGGLAL